MQNLSILQSQVESLKEMIEIMEHSSGDLLSKKWRLKVFEELVRNKQQQILHSIEIKKFKEEEKKYRAKESQIKAALESAHLQASSLNLERSKLQKEVQILQSRVARSSLNSTFLLNLQSTLTSNLELNSKVLSMLDTFNHRITFSMSKVKTAKILHTREIFALRNKLSEESTEKQRIKEELGGLYELENSQEVILYENQKLTQQLAMVNDKLRLAEKYAKGILEDSNVKFKNIVSDLELQLNEKVTENNHLLVQLNSSQKSIEKLSKANQGLLDQLRALQQEAEISALTEKSLKNSLNQLKTKNQELQEELAQSQNMAQVVQSQQVQISDLTNKLNSLTQALESSGSELQSLKLSISKYEKALEDSENSQNLLYSKSCKLETSVKDLKRERDILIETLKKAHRGKDEESQTDTMIISAALKKTRALKTEDDLN